jgi:hypothetical protein
MKVEKYKKLQESKLILNPNEETEVKAGDTCKLKINCLYVDESIKKHLNEIIPDEGEVIFYKKGYKFKATTSDIFPYVDWEDANGILVSLDPSYVE